MHAFVIVFTLSICLLLLHFNIPSGINSVSDTCKLSYFMIIKRFSMQFHCKTYDVYWHNRHKKGPIETTLPFLYHQKISIFAKMNCHKIWDKYCCKKKMYNLIKELIKLNHTQKTEENLYLSIICPIYIQILCIITIH